MISSSISVLATRATELVNDSLMVLLEFHSLIIENINEDLLIIIFAGLMVAQVGRTIGAVKSEDFNRYIFSILLTMIMLYPLEKGFHDFNGTTNQNTQTQYAGGTYKVALGPYYIQEFYNLIYSHLANRVSNATMLLSADPGSTVHEKSANHVGAMSALQAISLSNSSVGYLMERTPLYSTLIAYNQICSPIAATINRQRIASDIRPLSTSELLSLGLNGGANFIGRAAMSKAYDEYNDNEIWPSGGDYPVKPPTESLIESLSEVPRTRVDLVPSGIMIMSTDYWREVGEVWIDFIKKNPNYSYEAMRRFDVLSGYKTNFSSDATSPMYEGNGNFSLGRKIGASIVSSHIETHNDYKYTPIKTGTREQYIGDSSGFEFSDAAYDRFYPGDCQAFYELAFKAYLNFFEGLESMAALEFVSITEKFQNVRAEKINQQTLLSVANSALLNLVDLQPIQIYENNTTAALNAGKEADDGFTKATTNLAVRVFSKLEAFFKTINLIISGPILISTLTTGLGLLFAISPIWLLVQTLVPSSQHPIIGYLKITAMAYVFLFFLFISTQLIDFVAQFVLQAHILNSSDISVVLGGEIIDPSIFNADRQVLDPLQRPKKALNSLDVQILGIHFVSLMMLGFASYASYLVVQGADKGLKAFGSNVTHADKGLALAAGMALKVAAGAITGGISKMASGLMKGASAKKASSMNAGGGNGGDGGGNGGGGVASSVPKQEHKGYPEGRPRDQYNPKLPHLSERLEATKKAKLNG